MIAPITNMTIRGTIWYQGESNTNDAYRYRDLFPTMIDNWRCDFKNYQMPFYFVQLASFTDQKPGRQVEPYRGQPRDHSWAELREAQFMTSFMKNNGMAVIIDIGESNCIHPANKKDVGERLALWALAKDYGHDIECSGPLYAGYKIEGRKIRVMFSHAQSGLIFKDGKPKGFAIAGEDKKFVWADAQIDGDTVLVYSDAIDTPVAVRYAWDVDPENSLYNKSNLPASPFRTDDWNGLTFGKK
ncbi:MAG: sialate O-acetylesterase [Sedimentisphaeraceae bacterium JB056]